MKLLLKLIMFFSNRCKARRNLILLIIYLIKKLNNSIESWLIFFIFDLAVVERSLLIIIKLMLFRICSINLITNERFSFK